MSFLDNLESSLKNLESRDERDAQREHQRREADMRAARAVGPYAEQLKDSPFTASLLADATRIAFAKRMKVNILWLGTTLRLEARGHKLELRPEADGIFKVFIDDGVEAKREPLDLSDDPERIAREWLESF